MPLHGTPDHLDVPLVWAGRERDKGERTGGAPGGAGAHASAPGPLGLWSAVLVDAGMVVAAVVMSLGGTAALGAELGPGQIVLAGLAGLELATVVGCGCLWGWRATPGMLLLRLCFSQSLPWGRVYGLWISWLLSMPLVGFPLLLAPRGERLAERLAGGSLTYRSSGEGA